MRCSFLFWAGYIQDDQVQNLMTKFDRSAKREYTVITPLSPMEDLEAFLMKNLFALGAPVFCVSYLLLTIDISVPVDTVTDSERKFVLAVATQQDLDVRPCLCISTTDLDY
jgi:hypothetical protein